MEIDSRPPSPSGRNPRKYPRFALVTRVESVVGGKHLTGRMGDVSVGGILILSQDTLDPQTKVLVRFDLPGGRHVEVEGEVVHSTPGIRMGIKFLALDPDLQKAIAEYAEQIKPYKRRSARLPRRFIISSMRLVEGGTMFLARR